jgi:hypothetical protein
VEKPAPLKTKGAAPGGKESKADPSRPFVDEQKLLMALLRREAHSME